MSLDTEIFALDIGTRTVVGLVGTRAGDGLHVIASSMAEHSTRAMLDGQIHDIEAVAAVVLDLKEQLEASIGHPLHNVAVAAAGRSLRTLRGFACIDTFSLAQITRQQVLELELAAVQQAQLSLVDKEPDFAYYQCVGYSVVDYKLDGSTMSSLLNHRGSQIEAQVVATFLPRSVVDSLYSVLDHCNLTMRSLTLEPIAAISVAIPPSMRNLNLALVDIGAGTSDIALVSTGTIQNYAMAPTAGDEITEYLCNKLLLDFNTGERIKRSLELNTSVKFQDVLGVEHEVSSARVLTDLLPSVQSLAKAISDRILQLNGGAPAAVVLIGGGSLTPHLPSQLAHLLGLPEQRVAVRSRETIPNLHGDLSRLQGPASVTPVGIALTSLNDQALSLLHVEVNKRPVRLFSLNQGNVADALLAAGFSLRRLHGKPGMALSVSVNGKLVLLKGEMGISATIRCNGITVDLDTPLHPGDCLEVTPSRDGAPGKGMVQDVLTGFHQFSVNINGREVKVVPRISLNNSLVTPETLLIDRAEISWEPIQTVSDLLSYLEVEPPLAQEMEITVNGYTRTLKYTLGAILVNGQPATPATSVLPGDDLQLLDEASPRWRVRDIAPPSGPSFIDINLNDQARSLPGPRTIVKLNGKIVYGDEPLQTGDCIEYAAPKPQLILTDLFKYIDFQPTPPPGTSRLIMEINGIAAEFTSTIKTGDRVTLTWV